MRYWLPGLLAALLALGCAAFEQSPNEIPQRLSEPEKGHLYVPEPAR